MPIITHIQPIVFCLWAVKPIKGSAETYDQAQEEESSRAGGR